MSIKAKRILGLVILILIYTGFIIYNEKEVVKNARSELTKHVTVVENALWNYNKQSSQQYLKMVSKYSNYASVIVYNSDGEVFLEMKSDKFSALDSFLYNLKIIRIIPMSLDVFRKGLKIGTIEVKQKHDTVYLYSILFLIFCLLYLSYLGLLKTIYIKHELEIKVGERTIDLEKTNERLFDSERKYRDLTESISDWIWEVDVESRYVYASPKIKDLLGYTPEDVLGKTPYDLMLPDQINMKKLEFRKYVLLKQPFDNVENQCIHKNGSVVTLETSGVPIFDKYGNVTGYRGIDRDVTERKKSDTELKNLRNYLSNIINSMPSMLIVVNSDGIITQWNYESEKRSGISSDAAVGKMLTDILPFLEKELDRVDVAINTRQTQIDSKVLRDATGKLTYEDVVIYPLIANGVEGAVIRIDDVTDQVKMEEIIVQSEKMLSIGGLAAGMAHEINNPLAGMMQNADVLMRRLSANSKGNVQAAESVGTDMDAIRGFMERRHILRMLKLIHESGTRAAKIVDNMLSFARKTDSDANYFSMPELLNLTISLAENDYDLKKKYDFRQINIKKEYKDDLPNVFCESSKIQQVFLNLLKNGAEAMSQKIAEMQNKGEDYTPQFIVRIYNASKNMVGIEIEDNGPGMNDEIRRRVFEPFFTTKGVGLGTGLGLSVSYFIITENHGGTMKVDSVKGEKTKFTIQLPVKKHEQEHNSL